MDFKTFKKVSTSLFLSGLILTSGVTAFAADDSAYNHYGHWKSKTFTDFNGLSGVGTQYFSESAVYYDLYVRTGSDSNVGHKSGTVGKNGKIEHQCWGQPFLAKYGVVSISGHHNPWFNA